MLISSYWQAKTIKNYTLSFMRGSCHFDRALNVEIHVECRKIFVVVFFNVSMKCILGYLQDIEKTNDFNKNIQDQFFLNFRSSKKQESKQTFQNSTPFSKFDYPSK